MVFPEGEFPLAKFQRAENIDDYISGHSGLDMLRNPGMSCARLAQAIPELGKLDPKVLARVDIEGDAHLSL